MTEQPLRVTLPICDDAWSCILMFVPLEEVIVVSSVCHDVHRVVEKYTPRFLIRFIMDCVLAKQMATGELNFFWCLAGYENALWKHIASEFSGDDAWYPGEPLNLGIRRAFDALDSILDGTWHLEGKTNGRKRFKLPNGNWKRVSTRLVFEINIKWAMNTTKHVMHYFFIVGAKDKRVYITRQNLRNRQRALLHFVDDPLTLPLPTAAERWTLLKIIAPWRYVNEKASQEDM